MTKEIMLKHVGYRVKVSFAIVAQAIEEFGTTTYPDKEKIARFIKEQTSEAWLSFWSKQEREKQPVFNVLIFERYNVDHTSIEKDYEKRIVEYNYTVEQVIELLPEMRLRYITGDL